jgi:hypothetical protein
MEHAVQIVEFLESYNKHFSEYISFLSLKQQKVFADDLNWLHDSLPEEQRLSMAGTSVEKKRLELMESLGYADKTSAQIMEILPEEAKGRFKLECEGLEKAIDRIKRLNADILETVEKKLEAAEAHLKHQGVTGAAIYDTAGSKVRIGDPDDEIIGKM